MADYLACNLSLSDSRVLRFGPDEADADAVLISAEHGTSNPGGFAGGSFTAARPPSLRADDAKLFADAVIYGPEGTVYEGRVKGIPQVGVHEIRLELEGHAAHLTDDQTFAEIYVSRDLSRWVSMSNARRIQVIGQNRSPTDHSIVSGDDTGGPGLEHDMRADWGINQGPRIESWYDAIGSRIARIYADWRRVGTNADFYWSPGVADDMSATNNEQAGDLQNEPNATGTVDFIPTTPRRWAFFQSEWRSITALTGQQNRGFPIRWTNVVLFGDHGLPTLGDAPGGILASDIIAHALGKAAPLLNHSEDSVPASTYPVPHAVFTDASATVRSVVEQLTPLSGETLPRDWGVYESREFFWKPPGSYGRTWKVRRDQVATPDSDGPDAERRINGIQIRYRDGAGEVHTVGPPGSSSETETTALLDTDPANPAQRVGRKWVSRDVGITNLQGATLIGQLVLREMNRLHWKGSVSVQGTARDAAGTEHPVRQMRAGDRVEVEDDSDFGTQTINSTSHSHDSLTTTAHIGAPPDTAEVLLARLAAVTDLALQG